MPKNSNWEDKLRELLKLQHETEWVEFKVNDKRPVDIGEYISALSNSAVLNDKDKGYLVFGVEDKTHKVVGTKFKPKSEKEGNEELENWLTRQLDPRVDFTIHELSYQGNPVVLFEIDKARDIPIKFNKIAYIRIGSYKKILSEYPEKERKIWNKYSEVDWSAQICEDATLEDLEPVAIKKARIEFANKNPKLATQIGSWSDEQFLNKAKIIIKSGITRCALLLLGKAESAHFLSPSVAQITWALKDGDLNRDYQHFGPPFLLTVDQVLQKIRNLTYRHLPDGTLFPIEITQYDPWVIREALHNCIAHQDYSLRGRINIIENRDELIFTNLGSFLPGSIENVIAADSPPDRYRNPCLSQAMVALNMIDTIGGGIKKMYETQRVRFFPLPDYDLSNPQKVIARLAGKIIDENYTKLLIKRPDLDLPTIILLDKVQRKKHISNTEHLFLKKRQLVEGRYPNLFISSVLAIDKELKAKYLKNRGFDKEKYQNLIINWMTQFGSASREDINEYLLEMLPKILTDKQKRKKIDNLLGEMSRTGLIVNQSKSRRFSKWVIAKKNP